MACVGRQHFSRYHCETGSTMTQPFSVCVSRMPQLQFWVRIDVLEAWGCLTLQCEPALVTKVLPLTDSWK